MDTALLSVLACPKCRGELLHMTEPAEGLACTACAVVYPVEEGIPVLLIEESIPKTEWDAGKTSKKERP